MTDRISAFIVVLEEPLREDAVELEKVKAALGQIKGVVGVEPHVAQASEIIAESRARHIHWVKINEMFIDYLKWSRGEI